MSNLLTIIVLSTILIFKCCDIDQNNLNKGVIVIEGCQSRKTINVKIKDTIIVKLVQHPGNGSSWSIKKTPEEKSDGIKYIGKSVIDDVESLDGGAQTVSFKLVVKSATQFKLLFEEKYPYDSDTPPRNQCSFEVIAK